MTNRKTSHDALSVALQLIDRSVDRLAVANNPDIKIKLGAAMAEILDVIDLLRSSSSELKDAYGTAKRLDFWQQELFEECLIQAQDLEADERLEEAITRVREFLAISSSIRLRALARDQIERLEKLDEARAPREAGR